MHGKRLKLWVDLGVSLLEAFCLLRMIQVTDTLLYELSDVSDLGQDFRIGASVNKALQIRVNCLDIVLVLIVYFELL